MSLAVAFFCHTLNTFLLFEYLCIFPYINIKQLFIIEISWFQEWSFNLKKYHSETNKAFISTFIISFHTV